MAQPSHSSMFVAPLHITKGNTWTASSDSQTSSVSPFRNQIIHVIGQPSGQITPPLTPHDTQQVVPTYRDDFGRSDFHTYLRAFYPYQAPSEENSSTVTLQLSSGDIILVHSIHVNGWADGTLLLSGARGWLPTNYCEPYESEPIRVLLNALTSFWDLVKGSANGDLGVFGRQDYVRALVAGVRYLLVITTAIKLDIRRLVRYRASRLTVLQEKTRCLTRESSIVQSHNGLRRNRKALLSDLSSFVKMAKGFEGAGNENRESSAPEPDLDEMVMKAFKMVNRAVKFLDVWEEDIATMESIDALDRFRENAYVPPTPPAERTEFGPIDKGYLHDIPALASAMMCQPAQTANNNNEDSERPNEANSNEGEKKMNEDEEPKASNEVARACPEQTRVRSRYSRSSQTIIRPDSASICAQKHRSLSAQGQRLSVSHRASCIAHPAGSPNPNLASHRLSATHDTFLGFLGSFIGLHLQSRSSSELLLTTQQSVTSCRDMLRVVEEIWERDSRRSELLEEARDGMYNKITDLVGAARDVFRPIGSGEQDEVLLPSEGQPLVEAATACVRGAGECVAESRFVIQRIGDFEFEPLGLGIDGFEDRGNGPSGGTPLAQNDEEQGTPAFSDLIIPIEPLKRPPPPPIEEPDQIQLALTLSALSPRSTWPPKSMTQSPVLNRSSVQSLLPPLIPLSSPLLSPDDFPLSPQSFVATHDNVQNDGINRLRADSFDVSSSGASSTYIGSMRDSETSLVSETSTRATSPDGTPVPSGISSLNTSFSGSQMTLNDDCEEAEVKILERTFAHELVYNKEGQISGGTLPALIEQLTTHDSTPDAMFVSTFYLTFRMFATPTQFAEALVDRFHYVGESPQIAGPVRLRVYNVFKGWLESHWRNDCDNEALKLILPFATRELQIVLPSAGKRLASLAEKVSASSGPLVPRLISSMGKTNTSIAQYVSPDTPLPSPVITKGQLAALKNWKNGGANISILDFDPLELARQFTIKESRIFCSILPEELLATEWTKKSGSMAVNVRAMSSLSTDLANLVADCILREDPKKRATIIKQWVKIASKCLELANYDSLMAIICSLNSSTILRLKRTWELVSSKTKALLQQLKDVVDVSRNYAVLRQRLQNHVPPCLPFVGTYLTDLTFVDVGNQTTRQLPGEGVEDSKPVINFDKHMKTAKIISDLQRFQIPYRFAEVPELQTWMQDQLVRVRSSEQSNVQSYYGRSLRLEPRESLQSSSKSSPVESQASGFSTHSKEKFELFGLGWTHSSREKSVVTPS